jgi:hypothetical protein
MLFEYAVEPQAIGSSWQNFRYLIEKFGFDRGRLISRFPRSWEREVIEAARQAGLGDVRLKSLVSRLQRAKAEALIASGRSYDRAIGDWFDNALAQHAVKPFRAIIVSADKGPHADVLIVDDVDDLNPSLLAPITSEVERTGVALAAAMAPLLQTAGRVLLVDKYFKFDHPRYKETLREVLATLASGTQGCSSCEIHFAEHSNSAPMSYVEQHVGRWLRGVIPNGMTLHLYYWREKGGGEDFHARYLLTNRGGMNVEAGFSADGAHQKVQMTLLDFSFCQTKVSAFAQTSSVYDFVGPKLEIASNGSVTRG